MKSGRASDSFDVVFSISVVEHVPTEDLAAFHADQLRILKPGGMFVHAIDVLLLDEPPDYEVRRFETCREWVTSDGVLPLGAVYEGPCRFTCDLVSNPDNTMFAWTNIDSRLDELNQKLRLSPCSSLGASGSYFSSYAPVDRRSAGRLGLTRYLGRGSPVKIPKPSPAMIVALIALFVAIGGTAVAADDPDLDNAHAELVGTKLVVTGAENSRDNLVIQDWSSPSEDRVVRVSNWHRGHYGGADLNPGPGCRSIEDGHHAVLCDATALKRIKVLAGERADRVVNVPRARNYPSTLWGGPGDDIVTGGQLNDTVIGGPGADAMEGKDGNDHLLARDGFSETKINCDGGTAPRSADTVELDLLPLDPESVVNGCETKTRG